MHGMICRGICSVSEGSGADGAAGKPKRSLEDMMGPSSMTTIGFGGPISIPTGFGAAPAGAATAPPEPAGAAFLRFLQVQSALSFHSLNIYSCIPS